MHDFLVNDMAAEIGKIEEHVYTFKVVLLGDSGVGKSNLLTRYTQNKFTFENVTVGVELETHMVKLNGKNLKVNLWDTAGQERFRASTSINYRDAVGALIVYDICQGKTLTNVDHWLRELRLYADEKIVIVLVGNKCDLEHLRDVPREEGQSFAERNHCFTFVETSALESTNVQQTFHDMISEIHRRVTTGETEDSEPPRVHLLSASQSEKQLSARTNCC